MEHKNEPIDDTIEARENCEEERVRIQDELLFTSGSKIQKGEMSVASEMLGNRGGGRHAAKRGKSKADGFAMEVSRSRAMALPLLSEFGRF